ncbi:MAG: hypothetical protein RLZZ210_120 [Pseudomonadota bacterium]|jgi:hypothetical protein
MNSLVLKTEPIAQKVTCDNEELKVYLYDGRIIAVPIVWFPRLMNATQEQRNNYQLLGIGEGIYWEDIDEDISVRGLLAGNPSIELNHIHKIA